MVLYTALRALLAQLVEQLTLNQRVEGSSPSRRTTLSTHRRCVVFCCAALLVEFVLPGCTGDVALWYIWGERMWIDQYQ
jgi:hypothetical protein